MLRETGIDSERVVLVDENDRESGSAGKLAAHESGGMLHRAFSVFVFDSGSRMLLQRRAEGKYHFGGLWTNTCCGHPRPGETVEEAASRRLWEEMGIHPELTPAGSFVYEAFDPESGLTERECDHVFQGLYGEREKGPDPDPGEVSEWLWVSPEELDRDLTERPESYTPWFPLAAARLHGDLIPEAWARLTSSAYGRRMRARRAENARVNETDPTKTTAPTAATMSERIQPSEIKARRPASK